MEFLRRVHNAAFPAAELLLGMAIAQAVATLQVHASNLRLSAGMKAVADAGFLPVPGPQTVPGLTGLAAAFWGGLFFTLSIGAGLSLLSVAAAWIWHRHSTGRRRSAAWLAFLPAAALGAMNMHGWDLWVSLYVILIPWPVFGLAQRFLNRPGRAPGRRALFWRALPLAVLAAAWLTQYDRGLFLDLRDHLLMSNAAGGAVTSFYYRYTLGPAEVFKPLEKRLIKTVSWPPAESAPELAEVRRTLIRNDYLPVAPGTDADLGIRTDAGRLVFTRAGAEALATSPESFLADPGKALATVSARSDRWPLFRAFTFYCVLLAFPTALYVLLFGLLRLAAAAVAGAHSADALAAGGCLLLGLGALAQVHFGRLPPPSAAELSSALASDRWQQRVAALKEIRRRGNDICRLAGCTAHAGSPHPQERYWLAQSLAASRSPAASDLLLRLADDAHLNVQTMALDGLARRGDRSAVGRILERLKTSPEWYVQLYAYQALKALGWNQPLSP